MCKAHHYLSLARGPGQRLNAYLYLPDDEEVKMSAKGILKDLTVAVKDNILVKNWPAKAASKILEGFISPYDATVIKRLKAAGATLIGRTNMDEFAMGSSTENSAYAVTKNPWDDSKVPGGSSGGSAAAVAAGLCDVALGSDTGGSIRQPAAFCGIFGHKPTYGSVSRYGLIALASSLDVIGPMTSNAETAERIFEIISGPDELDQTTIDYQYERVSADFGKLKIGLPKELDGLEIDGEIRQAFRETVVFFKNKGATVKTVSLPSLPYALAAYYIIMSAEASSNLARYDGMRYGKRESGDLLAAYVKSRSFGFGREVKRRILLGTYVLSVGHYDRYYQQALKLKRQIATEHEAAFKEVDVIMTPTTPMLPFKIGSRTLNPLKMYQADLLTVGASLAGVPSISMPCAFSTTNLPIGVQLIAAAERDNLLYALSKAYQQETDWHKRKPNVAEGDNNG